MLHFYLLPFSSLFVSNVYIRGPSSLSLSPRADAFQQCGCPHCAPFFSVAPHPSSLDAPLTPLQSANYLGSFITPPLLLTSTFGLKPPQPSSPLISSFDILSFSQKFKLRVYTQVVQSILLHRSESQVYSPAQISKIDSLHYKALRQIFQIKSTFYHRVLQPTDSPCSNEYLLSLAYPILPSCIPSSIRILDSRIKYLGHIFRHPTSSDFLVCFNNSRSFNYSTLSYSFYTHFTIVESKQFSSTSMKQWYNTTNIIYIQILLPLAENREQWKTITPKMK